MPKGTSIRDYDWWLLAIAFAICGIGVLEIWSATHASHLAGMQWKQISWIGHGRRRMLLLSRLDYHAVMDKAPILYLIGIIALIAVLAVGHTRFGAKRWLPMLGDLFQVSELVKLIIIVVLARFFSEVRTEQLSLGGFVQGRGADGIAAGADLAAAGPGHGAGAGSGRGRGRVSGRAAMEACGGHPGAGRHDGAGRLAFS